MRKLNFLCTLLVLASAVQFTQAFADDQPASNLKPANADHDCIVDKNDPYDVGIVMEHGAWEGVCMDYLDRRPVIILSEDDQKITFANFFHDKHFWIAEMPKNGVDQVIFQIAKFAGGPLGMKLAHTQLRIKMKAGSPIKLTPQDQTVGLSPTEITDIVVPDQVTAPNPLEDTFYFMKILSHSYGNFMRVMGASDRAREELVGPDTETRQYLLKITDEEKNAVLINAVHMSNKLSTTDQYQVLDENCTTVTFKILDQSIDYGKHVRKFKIYIWNFFDPIIGPSLRALKKRNIIDRELDTWNDETGLPDHPKTGYLP